VYRQPGRLILHLVNLTNEGAWRGPIDELISVGPIHVRIKLPADVSGRSVACMVSGSKSAIAPRNNWAAFELKSLLDHELIVIS
jgi:hypothetical protein